MPREYNEDCESGFLFVSVEEESELYKYFDKGEALDRVAYKYKLGEGREGDDTACYFSVPKGEERQYRDMLMEDPLVNNVEYVIDGVLELVEKLDYRGGMFTDLPSDIVGCSNKDEVNKLLEEKIKGIHGLKL